MNLGDVVVEVAHLVELGGAKGTTKWLLAHFIRRMTFHVLLEAGFGHKGKGTGVHSAFEYLST